MQVLRRRLSWAFILCMVSISCIYFWKNWSGVISDLNHDVQPSLVLPSTLSNTKTLFLYLTMTSSCLPEHLLTKETLGDSDSCRCHVLVLSWNKHCNKSHMPHHVRHIDGLKLNYGSGRNMLYEVSKHSRIMDTNYVFLTFFDDDLQFLYTTERFFAVNVDVDRSLPPLRNYEYFLLDHKPAYSSSWHSGVDQMHNKSIPAALEYLTKTKPAANWPDRSPMITFDGCFISFHRDAIEHLLPYTTLYPGASAQCKYMHVKTYSTFRGQGVRYNLMTVHNAQHNQAYGSRVSYKKLLKSVRDEAPENMKDHSVFSFDGTIWDIYKDNTTMLYGDPLNPTIPLSPKNHPIVPFKYIDFHFIV